MTLLVSAGLFARSRARLWSVDPGFAAEPLVNAGVEVPPDRYPHPPDRLDFLRRLEERLEARPEVGGVTASAPSILGNPLRNPLQAEGRDPPPDQAFFLPAQTVRPDFIDVMGIELAAGRSLLDRDA